MKYQWTNKKILFAEDDEASSVYLCELIKIHGASVIHCSSGSKALSVCIDDPEIDLVIMDMRLPEMDGYEATKMMKSLRPELPVIAVTACAMLEDRRRCKLAGCDSYLSKPVMPKEFLPLVQTYLFPEKIKNPTEYTNF